MSATHPDAGFASGPVEVHSYVDGRVHAAADAADVDAVDSFRVELAEAPPVSVHGRH